jgi:hypothetical protein
MYPPAAAPAAQPAPASAPQTTSSAVGGGVAPPVGPGQSGGGAAAPQPSFSDQLAAAFATEQAAVQVGQGPPNPAIETGEPPAPAVQPAAVTPPAPAPDTPEVAQLRQQAAQAQQVQAQLAEMRQVMAQQQAWVQLGQQAYLAQRQQAAPPAAQPESITGVPQFDHSMTRFIDRDDKGNLTLKPGAPPDLIARYEQYQDRAAQFYREFATDPMKFLAKPLEQLVEQRMGQALQQRLAEREGASFGVGWVNQNANVLYEIENGRIKTDWQGNRVLSPIGQMFHQTVTTLDAQGVRDPRVQAALAERIIAGELALARSRQSQPAPAQPPAQPGNPLAALAGQVRQDFAAPHAAPPAAAPYQQPPPQPPRGMAPPVPSFSDMLRAAAPGYGINLDVQ